MRFGLAIGHGQESRPLYPRNAETMTLAFADTLTAFPSSRMKTVFILWHVHEFKDQEDDVKLVGVYATERGAKLAQARAKKRPGFRRHPRGFVIDEYKLGKDHWTEGFAAVYPGIKLKDR